MTPNQWLLFVGVPALFAIVALIADWIRTARRKRIAETISRNPQSGTAPSKTEQTDPFDDLARVFRLIPPGGAEGRGEKPMGGAR